MQNSLRIPRTSRIPSLLGLPRTSRISCFRIFSFWVCVFYLLFLVFGFTVVGGCGQQAATTPEGGGGTQEVSTPIIRLYYTYHTDPTKKDETSRNFGSAYSSDGVNFTKDSGIRLGPVDSCADPDFFKESANKWILFYSKAVSSDPNENGRLYKATSTSPNGNFSDDSGFTGYELGNLSSTIKIGNTFYVYLVSGGAIKIATYEPTANKLILVGTALSGFDPSVIQISSNSFKMYYKVSYKVSGDTWSADSTDGLTWTNSKTLIASAEVPGAVYVNNKIYLYYTDSSGALGINMGVRISSDGGNSFSSAQVITGVHDGACDPNPVAYE